MRSTGIKLIFRSNVTIINITIRNFYWAIWLDESSSNTISENNIAESNGMGVGVLNSSNNTISGNNITNCWDGIWLGISSNNKISRNNITNSRCGLHLAGSSNNIVNENSFVKSGLFVYDSYENVVNDNMVNGKPLIYLEGVSNTSLGEAGQVVLVQCDQLIVKGLNLSDTFMGVELWQTNNTQIMGNNIAGNSLCGIGILNSSSNIINGNNITNNGYGIFLEGSSSNSICQNKVIRNDYGIFLVESSDNNIHHNNLINNTKQVYDYSWDYGGSISLNVWDDDYPSGGNYWSDYGGADLYGGSYQNETGTDGIGDAPYTIDANNEDRYPLMAPFNTFRAGVWNGITYDVAVISNSTVSGFNFNVDLKSVSFNVTDDDGTIGFCRVTIPKSLLWADDGWIILVDDQPVTDYTRFQDENFTYLYFTYNHSTQTVIIQGTNAIPEFSSTLSITMLMLTTLITTIILKTKRKRQYP
jgi:parallel beta-helix repeat protein